MHPVTRTITEIFQKQGNRQYGIEAVTQLEHALQTALLAEESEASATLVVAALLHDIGHIFDAASLPNALGTNLDDKHEHRANGWMKQHFPPEVADPARLHVLAKRYLCTVESTYEDCLSPTSRKSYHDQGGPMDAEEIVAFEREDHCSDALELRRWDDLAKDPDKPTPPISHFYPAIESCLASKMG